MAVENEKVNVTAFGRETEFEGDLSFSDRLVIAGKFSGKISATGDLEIAKGAVVSATSISARSVVVYGEARGNIAATERIELCSGSAVTGDLSAPRLRIASDVNFEGNVTMTESCPDADLFSVASAEYKSAMMERERQA